MAKNCLGPGQTMTVADAGATVASGAGFLQGTTFGVAAHDAVSGEALVINLWGTYELVKQTGQAWTQGAVLYWDDTGKQVTTTATGNYPIGKANVAAASGDALGEVILMPGLSLATG